MEFLRAGIQDKLTLLEQRNHVFAKHPKTTFIALHVANWPENLDAVSAWLKKYPNMCVEFGARQAELFGEFQDRILFGTDSEPVPEVYSNYFRGLRRRMSIFRIRVIQGRGAG